MWVFKYIYSYCQKKNQPYTHILVTYTTPNCYLTNLNLPNSYNVIKLLSISSIKKKILFVSILKSLLFYTKRNNSNRWLHVRGSHLKRYLLIIFFPFMSDNLSFYVFQISVTKFYLIPLFYSFFWNLLFTAY